MSKETVANTLGPASHRRSGFIGALISALVGFAAGLLLNHYGEVLLWSITPLKRFSWSVSEERNVEILIVMTNALLVVILLIAAVRLIVKRGFQPTTAILFGFSLGCLGYLLVGLWGFAQLVL